MVLQNWYIDLEVLFVSGNLKEVEMTQIKGEIWFIEGGLCVCLLLASE